MKKGFTLIELLVVVLIIGILAAVALPQYQKAVLRSRFLSLKQLTTSIYRAEQIYYLAHGAYTTNFDDLDIQIGKETNVARTRRTPQGSCTLTDDGEHINFSCRDFGIKMGYSVHLRPYPRKQCDIYRDSSDLAHKVCQRETGRNLGTGTIEIYYYVY